MAERLYRSLDANNQHLTETDRPLIVVVVLAISFTLDSVLRTRRQMTPLSSVDYREPCHPPSYSGSLLICLHSAAKVSIESRSQ